MSNPPREEHPYHPQDAIRQAGIATAITGGSGLAAAAIKSAMSPQNIGAFGAFTRFGGTIAVWSMLSSEIDGCYSVILVADSLLRT